MLSLGISNTLLIFLLFGSLGNFGGDFVVFVRFNWWLLSLVEEGLFIFQWNHVSLFLICWLKRRLEFGFMLQLGNWIITWMMRLLLLLCRMNGLSLWGCVHGQRIFGFRIFRWNWHTLTGSRRRRLCLEGRKKMFFMIMIRVLLMELPIKFDDEIFLSVIPLKSTDLTYCW